MAELLNVMQNLQLQVPAMPVEAIIAIYKSGAGMRSGDPNSLRRHVCASCSFDVLLLSGPD